MVSGGMASVIGVPTYVVSPSLYQFDSYHNTLWVSQSVQNGCFVLSNLPDNVTTTVFKR